MARVKRGTTVRQKHNKILERAKGFLGRHSSTCPSTMHTPRAMFSMPASSYSGNLSPPLSDVSSIE